MPSTLPPVHEQPCSDPKWGGWVDGWVDFAGYRQHYRRPASIDSRTGLLYEMQCALTLDAVDYEPWTTHLGHLLKSRNARRGTQSPTPVHGGPIIKGWAEPLPGVRAMIKAESDGTFVGRGAALVTRWAAASTVCSLSVRRHLGLEAARFVVIGNSEGGMKQLAGLLLRDPASIAAVLAVVPVGGLTAEPRAAMTTALRMLGPGAADMSNPAQAAHVLRRVCSRAARYPGSIVNTLSADIGVIPAFARIAEHNIPGILVGGARDRVRTSDDLALLAQQTGFECVIVPGGHHDLMTNYSDVRMQWIFGALVENLGRSGTARDLDEHCRAEVRRVGEMELPQTPGARTSLSMRLPALSRLTGGYPQTG